MGEPRDVAVVTALFGRHDELRPQAAQDIDVEWICFTDDPNLGAPQPWKLTVIAEDEPIHPNLAAKRFKLMPPVSHRFVVWIDANMEVTSPTFVRETLDAIHDGIALHLHPRRKCIYAEAEASLGSESQGGKYDEWNLMAQVMHYRQEGHPEDGGLWACGTIAWDRGNAKAIVLGAEWLAECLRWSPQDQLSFPVVCRRLDIKPGALPWPQLESSRPVLANRHLKIHPHL